MFNNPLLIIALLITSAIAIWGIVDNQGLAATAAAVVGFMFRSRGWFVMLTASTMLIASIGLAVSPYGKIRLGHDDDRPEFSTISWLTMLFAAGMGVGKGMALLSNIAMAVAVGLMMYVLLTGPTAFLMSGIVESLGSYATGVLAQGFKTYTFFDETVTDWFNAWTLTYMVWWLAWAPFVGVFIARISRGRTIREFILGVVLVPTVFSLLWFGVFGGIGFYAVLHTDQPILEVVHNDASSATFFVLEHLPLTKLTTLATVIAAFLFVVTSVVSAAYVLGMFSSQGDLNPSVRIKLIWGVLLGALGLVMILSDSMAAIKSIIALGALPFVYIVLLLMVCLFKALKEEQV